MKNYVVFCSIFFTFLSCSEQKKMVYAELPNQYRIVDLKQYNCVSSTMNVVDSVILYSTWNNKIVLRNLFTQKILFEKKIGNLCYVKPVLNKNRLIIPLSDNTVACLDYKKDSILWSFSIVKRCKNIIIVNDTVILVDVKHYGVVALNSQNGKKIYELLYDYNLCNLPDLSPYSMAVDNGHLYISNWQCNALSCFNLGNGKLEWARNFGKLYYAGESVIKGDYLFIGMQSAYKDGKIVLLNKKDGSIVYERPYNYEEHRFARSTKSSIYFTTFTGTDNFSHLLCFNVISKTVDTIFSFNDSTDISGSQFFLTDSAVIYTNFKNKVYIISLAEKRLKSYLLNNPILLYMHKHNNEYFLFL